MHLIAVEHLGIAAVFDLFFSRLQELLCVCKVRRRMTHVYPHSSMFKLRLLDAELLLDCVVVTWYTRCLVLSEVDAEEQFVEI
jgi:hypothetical protein